MYTQNKTKRQSEWTEAEKLAVWNKGKIIPGYDSTKHRQDMAGAWMTWGEHGNTNSETGYGWEVDHKNPVANGGSDDMNNLQPLQWHNNRTKGDNYPSFTTSISSSENKNIKKTQSWTFS